MPANIDIFINGKDKTAPAFNTAKANMSGLGKSTESTTGKLNAMTVAVGTVVGNLATAAINKMGEFATSILRTGINFDNLKEQANIAFTTMLGSAQKAQSFLTEMQRFAAQTPFEFPDLLLASQRMLAMGFESDKVLPTLTAIGDAVAGLGGSSEQVDRVTNALGQMRAKGKVSAEEMMQLTEAGIPAWELLAEKIGVSIPEAMDMVSGKAKKTSEDTGQAWQVMSDGVIQVLPKFQGVASGVSKSMNDSRISAVDAIDAIVAGMNDRFGGMMEKQSKTFGGLVSTIKDTLGQVSGTVVQPFFDLMTDGLQMIVDWTNSTQFTAGIERFTRWIEIASQGVRAFFTDIVNGRPMVDAIGHALAIMFPSPVVNLWNSARKAFSDLMDVIAGRTAVVEYFGAIWNDVWTLGQRAFSQLTIYMQTNYPVWEAALLDWGRAALQWLIDAIPATAARIGKWADTLFGSVAANLPLWAEWLQQWGQALWQWVLDAWPAMRDTLGVWFSSLLSWYAARLPDFIAMTLKWAAALVDWIGNAITKGIDAVTEFVHGLQQRGEDEGGTAFGSMARGWTTILWRWIQDDLIPKIGPSFNRLISAFADYYPRLLQSLGGLVSELAKLLWQWIVDVTPIALKKISEWGGEVWGWIADHKQAWFDKLAEWGKIAWEWITKIAIPEATKKIAEWGAKLWDWVKDNAPKFWDQLMVWAGNLWGWIIDVAWPNTREAMAEWAGNLWDWLSTNAPLWWDKMKQVGADWMQQIWDAFEQKWIEFTHWFFSDTVVGKFIGDIFSIFGVQIAPLYGIIEKDGQEIVYSLRKGVDSKLNEIHQAGASMGNSLQTGLRSNLDMHSPSRVMWGFGEEVVTSFIDPIDERLEYIANMGRHMGRSLASGLKSEVEYVAEQVRDMMARTTSEINAYVDYFTQQSLIKAQTASRQIANAAQDAAAILKQLGVDTSKVIGYGPNGELILPGITNLPKTGGGSASGGTTGSGGNYVPTETEKTTLAEALGLDKIVAQAAVQSMDILGGITLSVGDIGAAKDSVAKAAEASNQMLTDYAAGIGDFLTETLTTAQNVFRRFARMEQDIINEEGSLKDYVTSETYGAKQAVQNLYSGMKNYVADILGVSRSALDVDSISSGGLISKISELVSGTGSETDIELIGKLLQTAVDFRNTSNYGLGRDYYTELLPTDARLTGDSATTNNYNITLQGSSNGNADVLSLVQLLGSLQPGAASP